MEPQPQFANIEEIKKLVLQGNITGSRLSALRLPRDLTLGGTKAKRVFTPNINAVRNKDRDNSLSETTKSIKRPKLSKTKHVPKKSNLLQSEGVFSQGMGEGKHINNTPSRSSLYEGKTTNVPVLDIPTLNKSWKNVNKNEEKLILDNLMKNSVCESESDSEDHLAITLPLEFINKPLKQQKKGIIKKEVIDDKMQITNIGSILDVKPIVKNENLSLTETTSKLFDDNNPAVSLFRLPSGFPGKVFQDVANENDLDLTMADMHDGPIGKVIIRKSGSMELLIKNTKYNFTADKAGNFVNYAMLFPGAKSIALEPSLVTLGGIEETVSISPDWECLFKRARRNPRFYY